MHLWNHPKWDYYNALVDKKENLIFITLPNSGHNYISNSKKGNKKLNIIPLDRLEKGSIPKLIKIDVEDYKKSIKR